MISRDELLEQVRAGQSWDVIVIGGGATGLGAAVDAAARGYRTLLLEAADFAKGTSSRSTKLVHGGVRYLAQGNIKLVREALYERGLLRANAPHLVHALEFVVPAYSWYDRPWYGLGLTLYDVLAGRLGIGRTQLLSREETLRRTPTLEPEGLRGGIAYFDGQFDDTRLAVTLLRTLLDLGGTALNYAPVTGLTRGGSRTNGVLAYDAETGEPLRAEGKVVINATGVFADTLRRIDDPAAPRVVVPSQGVHIVLDKRFLPGETGVMIPKTADGRVLFAVPWHERVIVGTTDTPVARATLEPRPLEQELEFLLEHTARYFTHDPQPDDVLSMFAGLRPLVKVPGGMQGKELPRDHTIIVSPTGLVTITGGKWTTYRRMGEDVIDQAVRVGGLTWHPGVTAQLHLHGWQEQPEQGPLAVYGADTVGVRQLMAERPALREPLHPALPYTAGEVVWAARYEMARTVEDVLARRTRALLLNARASREAAPRVAELLAAELGLDATWRERQIQHYQELAAGYLISGAATPETAPQLQQVS